MVLTICLVIGILTGAMTEKEDVLSRGYFGEILTNAEYYALTLTVDEEGRLWQTTQTHFMGWANDNGKPGVELRAPSLVDPLEMIARWKAIGEFPTAVINNAAQYAQYYCYLGGNAVIERGLAEAQLPDRFRASPAVRMGMAAGFSGSKEDVRAAARRFPAPKSRMAVLRRDSYRCGICGRNAGDSLDLRLHTHHILEYAAGGPTLPWNLVTLCQTCHEGLGPEEQHHLYEKTDRSFSRLSSMSEEYWAGVRRYRVAVAEQLTKIKLKTAKKNERKPRAKK